MKNTTIFSSDKGQRRPGRMNSFLCRVFGFILLAAFLAGPIPGFGQYYNVNPACSTPFNDISATGDELTVNPDFNTFNTVLPFNFQFFGQNYTTPDLKVSVDGYILWNTLAGQLPQDNESLPTADPDINPGGGIFPHWDYQAAEIADPGVGIFTQVSGVAPNRTFTIQWAGIQKVLADNPSLVLSTGTIDFQVIFYETTHVIRFVYGDTDYGATVDEGSSGNNGASATIGIQRGNAPGTTYLTSYNNSAVLSASQCISYTPAQTTSGCTMACNTTNISIPLNCQPVLLAEDFLSSAYNCATSFVIQLLLTETGPVLESGVDSLTADGIDLGGNPYPLVGQTYVIKIMENLTGGGNPQVCWNYHTFQDYLPPVVDCRNADTVSCYEPMVLYSLNGITDCSGALTAHVIDSTYTPFGCDDDDYLLGRLIRTYYLSDASGNNSDTCRDTLYLAPPDLDDIEFPASVLNLQCSDPFATDPGGNPAPSITGVPTIGEDDIPIFPSNLGLLCNMSVEYNDQVIPAGCNTKILRTWTVYYWSCSGEETSNYVQTIMINDTVPPVVVAPADVTIAAGSNCSASFLVPPAVITDDCGHLGNTVVTHPNGVTPLNGGFTINNIPVGVYNIVYSVNDGCGNIATDTMKLTVQDLISPAAVCKDAIVSLDNTGHGRMFASSINNGSHDNGCGPVTIKVRRMNPDCNGAPDQTEWADYIDFYCCDISSNPIPVILQVTDAGGLTSTCMANVTVQNKNTPVVVQPLPNITVKCGTSYDPDNLALTFGRYVTDPLLQNDIIIDSVNHGKDGLVSGICSANISEILPAIYNLSTCGFGTITRSFRITDGGSFQNIVTQTITLTFVGYELTADDFNAPIDYVANSGMCDPGDVANQDLGAPYEPTLKANITGCHNLMYNKEDVVFNGTGGACFKIVRTWTIIDWCLADAMGTDYAMSHAVKFSHAIVVMNTVAPTFVPHADQLVETENCSSDNVTVSTSATDDCPASFLTYSWEIDYGFNNVVATWDDFGSGSSFTLNMVIGRHRVHFAVSDGCGNVSHQYFFINVNSIKKPTPVMKPLVVDLMADLTVTLPARLFNHGSFGACPSSNPLRFSYSSNPADSLKTFDCSYGVDEPFQVPVYVIDNNGLYDFVYASLTLNDNIVPCPDNTIVISGKVVTETSLGIPQVEVNAQTSMMRQTDSNGEYRFNNVQPGTTYNIEPRDENNPLNGVTTGDIIKIQNHILNKSTLSTPYKIIAADVNEDKSVSVSDIVMIRKLILGKIDQFSTGKSWKFVDQAYSFQNPASPLKENYPQSIAANTTGILNNVNFVGVKLGDVNGDFTLNFNDGEIESRNQATLSVENMEMRASEVVAVHLKNSDLLDIQGLQAAFALNPSVRFAGMESDRFAIGEDNYNLSGNTLKISVAADAGNSSEYVITLYLIADHDMSLSDAISINNDGLNSELYDAEGNATGFGLSFQGNNSGLVVEQNVPNPFTDRTQISFTLAKADDVTLKIYDINGRILRNTRSHYTQGRHTITIENGTLNASGVLFYELTSNQGSVTQKMIKLK